MSQREIGKIVGVDEKTVRNDLKAVAEDSAPATVIEPSDPEPANVIAENSATVQRMPMVTLLTHEGEAVEYPEPITNVAEAQDAGVVPAGTTPADLGLVQALLAVDGLVALTVEYSSGWSVTVGRT